MTSPGTDGSIASGASRARLARTSWIAALVYAWVALGPIVGRQFLPPSMEDAGFMFERYVGPELLYFGAAAVCAWSLLTRRALAVSAAWFVAAWGLLGFVQTVVFWTATRGLDLVFWIALASCVVLTLLAWHVTRLRRDAR